MLAGLSPLLGRLAGIESGLLGELKVRSGGKVPSAPEPSPAPGIEDGADGAAGPDVLIAHWLRDLTNCGGSAAGRAVRTATDLRELPLVLAAVQDGRIGMAQAVVLTRLVGKISPAGLAEAEPALIEVAEQGDPHALGLYVSDLLATWCEPEFDAQARSQESKRYFQTSRESDGMLFGRFRLTAGDSETLLALLEPLARRAGLEDDRDAGKRRADALVEVFDLGLRHAKLGDAGGLRPQLSYVIPAGWAAGMRPAVSFAELVQASIARSARPDPDLSGSGSGSGRRVEDLCARGVWSGPQTRSRIEALLCDARLTRVLIDTIGQVKSLTALGDTITQTQRRALAARDHGCVARGCSRPPAFCDAHHLEHLADGGATYLDNLVLLCRRHHLLWHQGRLHLHHLHVPWLTDTTSVGVRNSTKHPPPL